QFLNRNPMTKAIILGDGSLVKGFLSSLSQRITVPCEEFRLDSLNEIKTVHIKNDVVITPVNLVSVSAVIESPVTVDYNLEHQETWFAFSNQSRASFLQYLLELTANIDTKSTGLDVEHIALSEKEMILKARVRDYEALKVLERELGQSKLFSYVEPQENLQFTMKIILATTMEEL